MAPYCAVGAELPFDETAMPEREPAMATFPPDVPTG